MEINLSPHSKKRLKVFLFFQFDIMLYEERGLFSIKLTNLKLY